MVRLLPVQHRHGPRLCPLVTGAYGFLYFVLLDTREPWLVFVAIVLSMVPHDMMYGP